MPNDWTPERLLAFGLSLTSLENLSPARVQELGEALLYLTERQTHALQHLVDIIQQQAETITQQADVIATQADVIMRQAVTIEHQAAATQHLHEALQCLQAGVFLLGEEDHP